MLKKILAVLMLFIMPVLAEQAEGVYSQEIAIKQWLTVARYPVEALSGRPYLIVFWATWCPACVENAPFMKELYEKYEPQGLRILGLSIDKDPSAVVSFVKEKGVPYPVAIDGDTDLKYDSKTVPAAFLIDAAGFVVWNGYPQKGVIEKHIDKTLKDSPSPVLLGLDFSEFTDGKEPVEEGKSFMLVYRKLKAYTAKENPLKADAQSIVDTINTRLDALTAFAVELEKQKKDQAAINVYMAIVKNYGGTECARAASEKIRLARQKKV